MISNNVINDMPQFVDKKYYKSAVVIRLLFFFMKIKWITHFAITTVD